MIKTLRGLGQGTSIAPATNLGRVVRLLCWGVELLPKEVLREVDLPLMLP